MKQGVTLADSKGKTRVAKLAKRIKHIDTQIAELQDKRELMQYEIEELQKEEL